MKSRAAFACFFVLTLLAGCSVERHWITGETNQVIQAQSGDRFFLTLEENATTGYQWEATCDDESVAVIIDHKPSDKKGVVGAPGQAHVTIRVFRGYDGPSEVTLSYKRSWEPKPAKQFTITLFKRTGDCAFWE